MTLATLLARYGYVAVLFGSLIEGETVVLLGGFSAHRGYLHFTGVVAAAFVGSLAGDQLAYFVGRYGGERLLVRRPKWRPAVQHVRERLRRHETWLLVSFRFLYGLRNALPYAAGLTGVPPRRFVPLNVIGAALWAPTFSLLGYFFGQAIESFLHRARRYEEAAFGVLIAVGVLLFTLSRLRAIRRGRQLPPPY